MEGVERVLPGPPLLVRLRFPVPLQAVVGKGVGKEEGGCGNCRKPVVGDSKAGPLGLFLCLLHCHDELGNAGFTGPVAWEFAD